MIRTCTAVTIENHILVSGQVVDFEGYEMHRHMFCVGQYTLGKLSGATNIQQHKIIAFRDAGLQIL